MRHLFTRPLSRRLRWALFSQLGVLLGAVCLIASGCGNSGPNRGATHRSVGRKLPRLELQALTGAAENVVLADLEGQVALINFWGTWCPPCVEEFPHIAALELKFREIEGVRVLAIASMPEVDPNLDELRADIETFLEARKSDMPNYADVQDRTRLAVERTAGWQGYPMTIIVDREGVIRGVWPNYTKGVEKDMEAMLDALAAEAVE